MLAALLPRVVVTVEHVGAPRAVPLLGDEPAAVAQAVPARRTEYAAVRGCARDALERLGHGRPAVPSAPDRSPVWPPEVVGSMTHCDGYRAAAVAHAADLAGVGVDAEPLAPLPSGVLELVSTPDERACLAALPGAQHADRVLFSAKESVFKVWWPLVRTWLGFEDALVTLAADGTFVADLLRPDLGVPRLAGRWAARDGFVLTAVTLGHDAPRT